MIIIILLIYSFYCFVLFVYLFSELIIIGYYIIILIMTSAAALVTCVQSVSVLVCHMFFILHVLTEPLAAPADYQGCNALL